MMGLNDSVDLLLNKYCNELKSEEKRQRKKALENLKKEILGSDVDCKKVTSSFEHVQTQVIRCFKDNTEAVREYAVIFVTEVLKVIPAKESYLSSLMPVLSERLSAEETLENSEEVRLCLVLLISQLISKYKDHLFPYLNDFVNIFVKTIIDPYPKVKKESCDCAAELAQSLPQCFHMQSKSLIPPLVQTLSHQQYRIRVAGITSIGAVVRYGNNKSVSDVCGPLAERLFDQHHAVRSAVAKVVGTWLLDLPDRYSYFHKLLPLMLTSLTEEIPDLRREAEELWDKAGLQFLEENETDLKDKMDYLQQHLDHYPPNVCRPNLGCRVLVQRELSKYLPAISLELGDWKADVRVKSAQLLCVTVQHAEACVTQHLEKTLPPLYSACGDSDQRVADNIERAAEMIGYFVPLDVSWRLIHPSVLESTSPGPLRVLAAVLRSSPRDGVLPLLLSVADTLASEGICYNRQGEYQRWLLGVVASLQSVLARDVAPATQQLFTVCVSVLGLAEGPSISRHAQELLDKLAEGTTVSAQELYKTHSPVLLDRMVASVHDWTPLSPQRFVFEAILTHAGPAVGVNMPKIVTVLEACLNPETEPEATLHMLMAVSFILTHSEETLSEVEDVPGTINSLSNRVLQPQLVWRAGRAAEALRTAAVGCVLAALDLLTGPRSFVEPLVPLLLPLIEDSAFKTRQFATLSLLKIVQCLRSDSALTAQHISTIFVVVMKRLDDNNDRVRETAVHTLCELFRSPLPQDYSVECYRSSVEALYDTMLLHLDDPEEAFQNTMLEALKELSTVHPQLLRSRIQKDKFRCKDKCEQLIDFLEQLDLK